MLYIYVSIFVFSRVWHHRVLRAQHKLYIYEVCINEHAPRNRNMYIPIDITLCTGRLPDPHCLTTPKLIAHTKKL